MTSTHVVPTDTTDRPRGSDFARLTKELKAAGLLNRRRGYYLLRMAVNALLLGAIAVTFVMVGDSWWQLVTAAVLAVASTQLAFIGHDAGHRQIFRSHRNNDIVGHLHGSLTGISYQWWVAKHNRHHANPNHEDHDPDIEIHALAFSRAQAARKRGLYSWITKHQAFLFFPLLLAEAAVLRISGLIALCRNELRNPWREAALQIVPMIAYLAAVFLVLSPAKAIVFIAVHQGLMGVYLGCSFAPNHKGMPIITEGQRLDHLHKQVLTSRNVTGGRWVDALLGGLNHQIEHHLYPHMPRPNLRHAQPLVENFCLRHGIPYSKTTLRHSYAQVLRHLHDAGSPLRHQPGDARSSTNTEARRLDPTGGLRCSFTHAAVQRLSKN